MKLPKHYRSISESSRAVTAALVVIRLQVQLYGHCERDREIARVSLHRNDDCGDRRCHVEWQRRSYRAGDDFRKCSVARRLRSSNHSSATISCDGVDGPS